MRKPIMVGVSGSIGLLTVYFGILSLTNSPGHAIEEFANLWYWISILVVGFGIRLGLFFLLNSGKNQTYYKGCL